MTSQIPHETSASATMLRHAQIDSPRKIADSTAPKIGIRKLYTVTVPTGLYLSRIVHKAKATDDSSTM